MLTFEYRVVTILNEIDALAQFNDVGVVEGSEDLMSLLPIFVSSLTSPMGVAPSSINVTTPKVVAIVPGSDASSDSSGDSSLFSMWAIIGVSVGGGVLLIIILICCLWKCVLYRSKEAHPTVPQSMYSVLGQKPRDMIV